MKTWQRIGVVGIVIGMGFAGFVRLARPAEAPPKEASLYERLGGVYAIAAVVDDFSNHLLVNETLNANPALRDANQRVSVAGLKFMRTLYLCEATGGPFKYAGKALPEAHRHLHITSAEFDEVAAELTRTLEHFKVPAREQQEVIAFMASKKGEVVTAGSP